MKKFGKRLLALIMLIILAVAGINIYMIQLGKEQTLARYEKEGEVESLQFEKKKQQVEKKQVECAIILGAGITDSETPGHYLKDRLDGGIYLYKKGLVKKLLLTGDNGSMYHNEIHVMLQYCIDNGVPGEDIFCDHAGFNTFDSMYRAAHLYDVKSAVVVTQKFHIGRSIFLAKEEGIKAYGITSDVESASNNYKLELRELLARVKDFILSFVERKPKILGEKMPISGDDGTYTHGE